MINTIIFDLGNVIFTNDWHDNNNEKFDEFTQYFGTSYENMDKGWDKAWPKFKTGKITENEFWHEFLTTANSNNLDIEKAKELWRKHQKPIGDMLGLLPSLQQNYKLGCLTTISKEWLDFKIEKFNLNNYFEEIVSSGYFGIAKPNKEIYLEVLKELNEKPENCVFIDDKPINLTPANDIGIKTILFTNEKQLIEDLNKMGVNIYSWIKY